LPQAAQTGLLDCHIQIRHVLMIGDTRQGAAASWVAGRRAATDREKALPTWDRITTRSGVDKQKAVYNSWAATSGAYPSKREIVLLSAAARPADRVNKGGSADSTRSFFVPSANFANVAFRFQCVEGARRRSQGQILPGRAAIFVLLLIGGVPLFADHLRIVIFPGITMTDTPSPM